jgi:asparagine synthase (glutamine-hydrolysing)
MTILGYAGRWPEAVDAQAQQAHVRAHTRRGAVLARTEPDRALPALIHAPALFESNGVVVALHGRPAETDQTLAAQVHAAYLEKGRDCLQDLLGAFAVAIVDETTGRVLLAIDRMGVTRMAWAVRGGALAFGSSAEQVARFPGLRAPLRRQGLYDFLLLHMIPAPHTIFEGVHKLRPAHALEFIDGRAEVFAYWKPRFREQGAEPFERLRAELHEGLENAVRDCQPNSTTGSFLSGGLDSSTVAGKLCQVAGAPARTFSIGFGVDAYDELKYAGIAARHFRCDAFQYHVTADDVVTAFPLIAQTYDEPFGNSSAVPTYFCALRARERGVTHLLAGDGGDELFGGNERYARHRVFDWYFNIPGALRRAVLEPLASHLPGEGGFKPLAKLRSYIEQARIPLPERLETWNFVYREGHTMLDADFAASIDPRAPLQVMAEVYESAPARSTLNKMLYYDWYFTLADSDLRKVSAMCELAGVEVSYPMLDARIVELSNRVSPSQKMERLELRSFYKEAMRGFLPEEILRKTKHGFGLPFGDWLKSHTRLADMIYSHLSDLKARRIVKPAFLDELIEQQRTGHAMYYGYAIWDLAILEAWLQAHQTG